MHGFDPYEAARALNRRVVHVHAKDARLVGASRTAQEVPLGHGDIDWMQFLGRAGGDRVPRLADHRARVGRQPPGRRDGRRRLPAPPDGIKDLSQGAKNAKKTKILSAFLASWRFVPFRLPCPCYGEPIFLRCIMKRWLPLALCAGLGLGWLVCGCEAKDDKKADVYTDATRRRAGFRRPGRVRRRRRQGEVRRPGRGPRRRQVRNPVPQGRPAGRRLRRHDLDPADAATDAGKVTFRGANGSGSRRRKTRRGRSSSRRATGRGEIADGKLTGTTQGRRGVQPQARRPRRARRWAPSRRTAPSSCSTARAPTSGTAARSSRTTC